MSATTDRGQTALDPARARGHRDIVLTLEATSPGRGTTEADWKQADQECQRQAWQSTVLIPVMSGSVPLGPTIELGAEAKRRQALYDSCMRGRGVPAAR